MTGRRALEIMVVDDDPEIRGGLDRVLSDEGHHVTHAGDAEEAFTTLERSRFDVILLDIALPGSSGLDALPMMREAAPGTAVVMVSGQNTVANAVLATKRGAFDFVEKPLHRPEDFQHLLGVIAQAAQLTELRRHTPTAEIGSELGILGTSPAIAALIADIHRVAPTSAKVLVTGENGSGKDLVAHAIHKLSKRAGQPFEKLNCAALPRELVESELFGHEKGSFTGALTRKTGRLERAHRGTLFLDEIGDLSLEAQAKLLRAIETGEVDRVGGGEVVIVDVRVIAATHKDLRAAIETGEFRQDLYFRLDAVPLRVPALRERRGDIVPLARHFLAASCAAEGRPSKTLSTEAEALLEDYRWPGNVRELRNLMERAAILVDAAEVAAGDVLPWLDAAPQTLEVSGLRGEIERREADAIRRALEEAKGNVTQAARSLGIDRTNLHRKMRKYGLPNR
ncbi:MAG: sigma-54-dependent transcriptional regulator [Candidatus Eisenbacteria bacterium]